jgi:mono/diheme cytochrome c family protein
MSGLFRTRRRPAALALPLLLLPLCGCGGDGKYPADLRYPLRSDLIFVKEPTPNTTFYPNPPGHLDRDLATINARNGETLDPKKLSGEDRAELQKKLNELFGTPAAPKVEPGDDDKAVEKLRLDTNTLAAGSMLYRRHCLHCHGLSGDGRGPTGPWLSPHPRDYRLGRFKFISTAQSVSGLRMARRDDLVRTVRTGIDGSSMPSFSLLAPEELEQVVSYVIHLSLRGQVEYDTMRNILTNNGTANLQEGEVGAHCDYRLKQFLAAWSNSDKPEEPGAYPYKDNDKEREESIRRGYALFTDKKAEASCITCHTDYGRQVPFRYDEWGTLVRPANLTDGVYRGGRRPIDLYWRIRLGIPPSQMPAATALKRDDAKGIDQTWDLVNFVQALPYPQMLPEDIRKRIYVEAAPPKGEHAAAR